MKKLAWRIIMSNHNKELDERGTWVIDFTEKKITQQLTEEQIEEIKKEFNSLLLEEKMGVLAFLLLMVIYGLRIIKVIPNEYFN